MTAPIFTGRIIAVIWDFDQTLIPGYQQAPLFNEYHVDPKDFWNEVNSLQAHYKNQGIEVSRDTLYLNHILTYVREGRFSGLTNAKLRALGSSLAFHPGIPDFLKSLQESISTEFKSYEITLEHYIVSTGLRQIMVGSSINRYVTGIWGCEFIETPAPSGYLKTNSQAPAAEPVVTQVGYFLDNTSKTRAIWEINKGTNVNPRIDVNDQIAESQRRVPIPHMLFIADGPSDVPVFSILNNFGGQTLGVYGDSSEHFEAVKTLQKQGRVKQICHADYTRGSEASRWIHSTVRDIALGIVQQTDRLVSSEVRRSPGHVT